MKHDKRGRRDLFAATVLGALFAAGCEVTNPGPVPDESLVLAASQQGFVNGAKERLVRALGQGAYSTAFISRELFPGGTTGSYGQTVQVQAGSMNWNESGNNNLYPNLQQGRWIAEEALRRLSASTPKGSPQIMAEAYIWAGYANRMLGENYCEAVIDGGALQPGSTYFTRAEKHFTDAIATAPNTAAGNALKTAAYAGRAQVRVWLKKWSEAAADAAMVPSTFRFDLPMDYQTGNDANQRNHLYFGAASTPYRSYSVKFTFFEDYYTQTGDPRTPWVKYAAATDTLCVGSLQGHGRVQCLRPWKYKSENDPMRLASGREMRLIEAEALLTAGGAANIGAAMAKINEVRTSIRSDKPGNPALAPWPVPATLAEAWTLLKRERGIELWLEMRRMGDQRRWTENNTPGSYELPSFETVKNSRGTDGGALFRNYLRGRPVEVDGSEQAQPRVLCYNISDVERNSNPNIEDHSG